MIEMDVVEMGLTIEKVVYYTLGTGIVLGVLVSFLYFRYFGRLARIPLHRVAESRGFDGEGYAGRYRNDGGIEYIEAIHGANRVLVRFEEDGTVRIFYQEYEKLISGVKPLNIGKVKSKSAFFEFNKDCLVGTGNLDCNNLSAESLFQNFPVTIVPSTKSGIH